MSEKATKRIRKVEKPELSAHVIGAHNIDEVIGRIVRKETEPQFLVIDLFCGAGGTSTGFQMAGDVAMVIACINHDFQAIKSHWLNHPEVAHFEEDIRTLDLAPLVKLVKHYRKLYPKAKLILWASLECTNFSKAKGGQPRDADSRTLADHLERYILAIDPDYVQIENVVEFMSWGPLDENGKPVSRKNGSDWLRWRREICEMGYRDEWRELNSANFGAYTSRNRLFGIFARPELPIAWPEPTHSKKASHSLYGSSLKPWQPVKEVLDFSDEGESIFTRKKALSEKTLERIYAGLIKYVAGGKEAFLLKYNSTNGQTGKHTPPGVDEPCPTVACQPRLGLVQSCFLSRYYGGNPEFRGISLDEPAGAIRTNDGHHIIQASFLSKQFSGNPDDKNISVEGPAGAVTCVDHHALINACFIAKYFSGKPEGKVISVEGPAGTICTAGTQALVQPQFLSAYYGNGDNCSSVDSPAPTIPTKDRCALVQPQWLDKYYTSGQNHSSLDRPAGTVMSVDKHALVTAQPFIMPTSYSNQPTSIEDPVGVVTAGRKWHYLVNPSWGGCPTAADAPAPVIVARQDKAPLYLVCSETGDVAIRIDESDTACMRKIKEFMAIYGIIDIKMRMLKVLELLKIQGFPAGYHLAGNQSDQKKFIGNSVVPLVVKVWIVALHRKVIEFFPQLKTIAA